MTRTIRARSIRRSLRFAPLNLLLLPPLNLDLWPPTELPTWPADSGKARNGHRTETGRIYEHNSEHVRREQGRKAWPEGDGTVSGKRQCLTFVEFFSFFSHLSWRKNSTQCHDFFLNSSINNRPSVSFATSLLRRFFPFKCHYSIVSCICTCPISPCPNFS